MQSLIKFCIVIILTTLVLLVFGDWKPALYLNFSKGIGPIIQLNYEDGSLHYDSARMGGELSLVRNYPQSIDVIEAQSGDTVKLRYGKNDWEIPLEKNKNVVIDLPASQDWRTPHDIMLALGSAVLIVLTFAWGLWLLRLISLKEWLGFLPFVAIIFGLFLVSAPGFFGWDHFDNIYNFYRGYVSSFVGPVYSLLFIGWIKLIPSYYTISSLSIIFVVCAIGQIYVLAHKIKALRVFAMVLSGFMLYPTNWYHLFFQSRDQLAFWILGAFVAAHLYFVFIDFRSKSDHAILLLLAVLASSLRTESALVVIALISFVGLKTPKTIKKKILEIALVLIIPMILTSIYIPNKMAKAKYQATLLINPLSSILFQKYGLNLPSEENKKLGVFFKNDYLVRYHNEYDIDSYHQGGVNPDAEYKDYIQFREYALNEIITSPKEFLFNRWNVFNRMMGFDNGSTYFEDSLYKHEELGIEKFKIQTPLAGTGRILDISEYFEILTGKRNIYYQSYVIPCIVLLTVFLVALILRIKLVLWLLLILFGRAILVVGVAPAAYYKYQFPIWIFFLVVPILIVSLLKSRNTVS